VAITHPQLRRLEQSLGANPNASQVRNFRATVMQHLRDEEREESSMKKKKSSRRGKVSYGAKPMTEAEKKAFAAKMKAARAAKRGGKQGELFSKAPITLVQSSDGSFAVPLLPAGSPSSGGNIVLATPSGLAKMTKRGLAKVKGSAIVKASGSGLAKAMKALEGVLEEPKKKKPRRKKAEKAEVVTTKKPKRRRSKLTGDIRKSKPKKATPKKSKKSGSAPKRRVRRSAAKRTKRVVCYPIGSGFKTTAKVAKKRKTKRRKSVAKKAAPKKAATKKAAPKKPKTRKSPKKPKAAPSAIVRVEGGFVFPHAPGSKRKCVKCGRLHTLREHWSHKLMHGQKKTKHSYRCTRGGICVFDEATRKQLAEALRIESENTRNPRRQAELALRYYNLFGSRI